MQVALGKEGAQGRGQLYAEEICLIGETAFKPVEEEMEDVGICSRSSAEFWLEDLATLPVMPPVQRPSPRKKTVLLLRTKKTGEE